jgi:hypothetical protein
VLERSAPFFVVHFAPSEGADEGTESFFLPASNTISMTRLLASRFLAEIARVGVALFADMYCFQFPG